MIGLFAPCTGTFQQAVIRYQFVCGRQEEFVWYEVVYPEKSNYFWVFPDWGLRKLGHIQVDSFYKNNTLSDIADYLKEQTRQAMKDVSRDKRCKNWELVETKIMGELNVI